LTKINAQLRATWMDAIMEEASDSGWPDDYVEPYLEAMINIADGAELSPTSMILDDGDVDPKIDPHGAILQSLEFFRLV